MMYSFHLSIGTRVYVQILGQFGMVSDPQLFVFDKSIQFDRKNISSSASYIVALNLCC